MCLIETEMGIRNVDEIAAVPGVDVLWLGHFDLTNFLGIPAQFDHPKYIDAIERLVTAAKIAYQNGALRETPKGQWRDCRGVNDAAVLPMGYVQITRKEC